MALGLKLVCVIFALAFLADLAKASPHREKVKDQDDGDVARDILQIMKMDGQFISAIVTI